MNRAADAYEQAVQAAQPSAAERILRALTWLVTGATWGLMAWLGRLWSGSWLDVAGMAAGLALCLAWAAWP